MIKKASYFLITLFLISCNKSDDTEPVNPEQGISTGKITKQLNVNGTTRDYIVYIPENYTNTTSYPLVLAFHGLGGTMETSYNNSKLYLLAESENFIAVHPNGISNQWNAVTANNNIDVDFTQALLNQLEADYSIESNRIYSAGMSNGGFFSFLLACELSERIAAIGSVTGLMFQPVINNCQPTRPIPVLQIHGTQDNVVNYSGVDDVINFWINHNNTDSAPIISTIPNTNTTDGSTVERFTYLNGDNEVEIQHLKVTGGAHDWPGHQGNMDIDATEEIWNFLREYDLNGKI